MMSTFTGSFNMKLAFDVFYPPWYKKKNSTPVVMLHGMIDSRKTWKYIAPKIARNTGRTVYVVDARNHGDSPWTDEMDWEVLADDIGDFLTQHDIPKAVLVGHSMGGRASFTFALKRPEMVEKLIVEDISARTVRVKDGGIIMNIIELLRESLNAIPSGVDELEAKKAVVQYMKSFFPDAQTATYPEFDLDFIPLKKEGNTFKWQANLEALEQFLTTEKLAHDVTQLGIYDGDALFLYGTKSFFKVNKDTLIEKLFPRVIKIPFEGAYHLLHHLFPKRFEEVVTQFINKGSVPASKI